VEDEAPRSMHNQNERSVSQLDLMRSEEGGRQYPNGRLKMQSVRPRE
jgi:hypothetical protein